MIRELNVALLLIRVCLNHAVRALRQIVDEVGDEIALEFRQQNGVVKRTVGPVDPKQIGEAMGHHAKMAGQALSPSRFEGLVMAASDINPIHGAGHHVEPGGEDDDIQLNLTLTDNDPSGRKVLDGFFM